MVRRYVPHDSIDEQWDLAGLDRELESELGLRIDLKGWVENQNEIDAAGILEHVRTEVVSACSARRKSRSVRKPCARSRST